MKNIFFLLLLFLSSQNLFSQTNLQGKVTDAETGENILFGTVAIYKNDVLVTGIDTDFDGFYKITEIGAGTYDAVFSYTGYQDLKIIGVIVEKGKTNLLNGKLSVGGFIIYCPGSYTYPPLIKLGETTQGRIYTSDEIRRIAF